MSLPIFVAVFYLTNLFYTSECYDHCQIWQKAAADINRLKANVECSADWSCGGIDCAGVYIHQVDSADAMRFLNVKEDNMPNFVIRKEFCYTVRLQACDLMRPILHFGFRFNSTQFLEKSATRDGQFVMHPLAPERWYPIERNEVVVQAQPVINVKIKRERERIRLAMDFTPIVRLFVIPSLGSSSLTNFSSVVPGGLQVLLPLISFPLNSGMKLSCSRPPRSVRVTSTKRGCPMLRRQPERIGYAPVVFRPPVSAQRPRFGEASREMMGVQSGSFALPCKLNAKDKCEMFETCHPMPARSTYPGSVCLCDVAAVFNETLGRCSYTRCQLRRTQTVYRSCDPTIPGECHKGERCQILQRPVFRRGATFAVHLCDCDKEYRFDSHSRRCVRDEPVMIQMQVQSYRISAVFLVAALVIGVLLIVGIVLLMLLRARRVRKSGLLLLDADDDTTESM